MARRRGPGAPPPYMCPLRSGLLGNPRWQTGRAELDSLSESSPELSESGLWSQGPCEPSWLQMNMQLKLPRSQCTVMFTPNHPMRLPSRSHSFSTCSSPVSHPSPMRVAGRAVVASRSSDPATNARPSPPTSPRRPKAFLQTLNGPPFRPRR